MTDKTQIRRLPERGTDDQDTINAILDEGFVCHAAYVTEGRPVVIPTLYARRDDHLLLHGSNSMGLARAVRAGSPLSVAVTLVDGLVVARSTFHSSANYRSVVVHGDGELLDGDAKRLALQHIVDRLIPGRRDDVRSSTESEVGQTAIVRLGLEEVSAKVRTGPPKDDAEDLGTGVWAGVVPLALVAGEAVPAPDLEPDVPVPDYLSPYRR